MNTIRRFFVLALLLLPLLYQWYSVSWNDDVQSRYLALEQTTEQLVKQTASFLEKQSVADSIFQFLLKQEKDNAIYTYVFKDNRLLAWNDNQLQVTSDLLKIPSGKVIRYDHHIILVEKSRQGCFTVLAVAVIRGDYGVHNQYLKPFFNPLLHLSAQQYTLSLHNDITTQNIISKNGNFVFSIEKTKFREIVPLWIWLLFFIGIVLLFTQAFFSFPSFKAKGLFLTALLVVRIVMLWLHWPSLFYQIDFFQPYAYSFNAVFPSLGDSFLNIWFLLLLVEWLKDLKLQGQFARWGMTTVVFLLLALLMVLFRSIIFDSNVELYIYTITNVSLASFLAVLLLLLIAYIAFNLLEYTVVLTNFKSKSETLLLYAEAFILLFVIVFYSVEFQVIDIIVFELLFIAIIVFIHLKSYFKTPFLYHLIVALFLALSVVAGVFYYADKKEDSIKILLASKLSVERDYIAESLFPDIAERLQRDKVVKHYVQTGAVDTLTTYLKQHYFYGFWVNYDVQSTVCQPFDSLKLLDNQQVIGCYHFFDSTKEACAVSVFDSSFYFLNNDNGRISYLGMFSYYYPDSLEKRLFIEIDSKLISVKLGYPELLLGYDTKRYNRLSHYDYAKYVDGHLVSQYGKFAYPFTSKTFKTVLKNKNDCIFDEKPYEHLLYRAGDNRIIVLTDKQKTAWDFLQEFSYFLIILLVFIGIYRVLLLSVDIQLFNDNFKERIQRSVFLMLMSFFITVLLIMVYYSYNRINARYTREIKERIASLNVELSHKIINYDTLTTNDITYLSNLLSEFSNVFFSDIHLYAPDGRLLASSRPIVFEKKMIGTQMNAEAFDKMHYQKLTQYVHSEKIGNLSFLSAYMPFFNIDNKVLAYINFPYFTRQTEIHKQLAGMVVSIINVFLLLLIVSFFVLYFVGESLTKPLEVIRQYLASVRLGETNKKITYGKNDEIGRLVAEYNRMIDELQASARRLAESERESAWREMARQVAHEIKNPLTPMKLNIQYLQQTWNTHENDLPDFIDKITATLLEQIETLTVIANEFSNFATIPQAQAVEFDVVEKIRAILKLYENINEHIQVVFENQCNEQVLFSFDTNHFTQIINNLLKNAIQSIPANRQGEVKVCLKCVDNGLQITVTDNGIGIPEDIQEHIFQPNFTTKSGGMGVGLAMVKAMLEASSGHIRFETQANKGTTFFVDFFR